MNLKRLVKREIIITALIVVLISLGVIALSYALFRTRDEGTNNVITFGDLALEFCKDTSCGSTILNIGRTIGVNTDGGIVTPKNVYPLSDTEGLQTEPYIFKITNTGNLDLYLTLFLEPESEFVTGLTGSDPSGIPYSSYTSVDESEMKVALVENNKTASLSDVRDYSSLSDYKIQNPTKIAPGETKIYKLYVWQREESENVSQGKYFVTNIRAYGEYLITTPLNKVALGSYVAYTANVGCTGNACIGENATSCGSFPYSGWRIAYIEGNSAYLISAGATECKYMEGLSAREGGPDEIYLINDYNNLLFSLNSWVMNEEDYQKIIKQWLGKNITVQSCKQNSTIDCGVGNEIIDIGTYAFDGGFGLGGSSGEFWLTAWNWGSGIYAVGEGFYGVRPVVKILPTVYTTGGSGTMEDPYIIGID